MKEIGIEGDIKFRIERKRNDGPEQLEIQTSIGKLTRKSARLLAPRTRLLAPLC